jgi:uridine kinase
MEVKNKILDVIYKKIFTNKNYNFLIIDGITCSGKTTFSKSLSKFFIRKKVKTIIISKDLFLKSRQHRIRLIKRNINKNYKTNLDQNTNHYNLKKYNFLIKFLISKKVKKKIILKKLYNRKTGLNNKTLIVNHNINNFYILEGIYIMNDLKKVLQPFLKIFVFNDIYFSLAKKIQRIRDNKINLEDVIFEFKEIHLKSYVRYLKFLSEFDFYLDLKNNNLKKNFKIKTELKKLKKFLEIH